MMVAEESPSIVLGLMNETTDLYEAFNDTRAFVVHLLGARHRVVADRFAGPTESARVVRRDRG
jgi:flavin reductase (DIM6/NTAB) family NADH-FMN oxidoreductase RutF